MSLLADLAARSSRALLPWLAAGGALLLAATALAQTVDTTKPILVKQKKPKSNLAKFEGTVLHANTAQITVRGKPNELAVRTFPLSAELGGRMQKIVERGGYQHGDKVTVLYDPVSGVAQKIKGKPSKSL